MFRKPRETVTTSVYIEPSTGRPPTPPNSTSMKQEQSMDSVQISTPKTPMPLLGRSKTTPKANVKTAAPAGGRASGKSNSSILSFFKKADASPSKALNTREEESLFMDDGPIDVESKGVTQTPTPPRDHDLGRDWSAQGTHSIGGEDSMRYNEVNASNKRRRTSTDDSLSENMVRSGKHVTSGLAGELSGTTDKPLNGIKEELVEESENSSSMSNSTIEKVNATMEEKGAPRGDVDTTQDLPAPTAAVSALKREPTSGGTGLEFCDNEDFIDDEYTEGEEYLERRWMEEQTDFEMGLEEENQSLVMSTENHPVKKHNGIIDAEAEASSCPICGGSFGTLSEQDTSRHVNDCLDGKASPLPSIKDLIKPEIPREIKTEIANPKRFQRAAIARPGQENPFNLAANDSGGSSAFSKLMTGHAEDAAWATAAATEAQSRGKPAYQRTCPFYKILPGFSICVDAFRYGAVEGCKAYFLSHFHSDHYIGLTSSWCHGPIYCSRVTANLVRRQLRVDPKWVVDLEFDQKIDVPGTQVSVTMIPANHCPGSSLYLYEKVIGKGKNPKVQRVLHCGDFRACPAHVQHPLLRPDVVDAVSGKNTGQQKLDVCYLDTTYLTPKYAFPNQEEVIKACADMCVSLSKDKIDENDDWEQTKKERAGSGMVKFIRKDSDTFKSEQGEDSDIKTITGKTSGKRRGRLLVIVGTYSIGKERICLGVARALNSKIYATPNKQKICAALEDPELMSLLTNDPLEAQVHMQMIMEIRAETLADYLTGYKPHFSRIVGFRPSGWNYRPPNSRFTESPAVQTVLHSENWKSRYSMADLVPQRGSTREAHCFGVPYSEHSSFRELTMFCCALRIDKIIPTVNIGSAKSREKMKGWCEKWAMEKKKNGLYKVADGQTAWS
ncbi:MAG: hypothetical protein Q9168_007006 [Polycauliona sp. 1 TL-2023]